MDYTAFSHGQIQSKQWLCETLEPHVPKNAKVIILGCWYNILALMMLTRNHAKYKSILGIDIDPDAIDIANKVCDAWIIGTDKLLNIIEDASTFDLRGYDVVINCSPEHMDNTWFNQVESNTLVCIQASNVDNNDDIWKINNPVPSIDIFENKFPLSHVIMSGVKEIKYDDWGYQRFMRIGIK